jgi:hypothetical protein
MALLSKDSAAVVLTRYYKVLGHNYRGPRCVSSQVVRSYYGQAGSETLHVQCHREGRKDRYGLDLGLALFRLGVPLVG